MNPPEYSPSELEAMRLQSDIDRMVDRDCSREDEFDKFEKQAPRKTKPKKHEQSRSKPTVRPDKQVVTKTPLSPVDEALFAWMEEVTALLCFQPEVPMQHKEDLCKALNDYGLVAKASKLTGYEQNKRRSDEGSPERA